MTPPYCPSYDKTCKTPQVFYNVYDINLVPDYDNFVDLLVDKTRLMCLGSVPDLSNLKKPDL